MNQRGNNKILIIDDDHIVHKLLESVLKQAKYQIIGAHHGQEGLKKAEEEPPDLILLDVMMPEMDGFEVMKRLKANKKTSEIPVIFLSAKIDSTDKVHGLELGASDFVNKPFDRAELIARIRTQIKLKQQEETLKEYSSNLEKMVEDRTQQLIHADRLASLGTLSAGIAHEINNPTTFITGNLQTLEQFWNKAMEYLADHPRARDDLKIKYIIQEFPAMIQAIRSGADRITEIVSGLKTFARKDHSAKGPTNIVECLDEAIKLTHNHLKYYVKIEKDLSPDLPLIHANRQQITQILVNLMLNSADAIGENRGIIRITGNRTRDGLVEIRFSDNGSGIKYENINKIFDPFFTTKPVGQGTGLGLSITLGIIQDHKGTIRVDSEHHKGTTFIMNLPTEQKK